MSSFRRYGGLNRAATNNIVRNHYSNSDNPTISNYLGQNNSKIVSESHIDLSGNSILNVNGIYFDNGTTIIDGSFNGDLTVNGNLEVTKNTKLDGSLNVFGVANFYSTVNGIYINNGNFFVSNILLTTSKLNSLYGSSNTVVGNNNMASATSAGTNSCFGFSSGAGLVTGSGNTLIGSVAGEHIINGNGNTFVGYKSGSDFDGSYNTVLGYLAWSDPYSYNYTTVVGFNAQPSGDHQIVLGTAAETVIIDGSLNVHGDVSFNSTLEVGGVATFDASMVVYGDASFNSTLKVQGAATFDASMVVYGDVSFNSTLEVAGDVLFDASLNVAGTTKSLYFVSGSDYRIKTDVKPLDNTFKIDMLNPVVYKNKLSGKQDTGFIAHEVQEVFPHLVTGEKDGEQIQSLNYQGLIAILTKEIQELKKRVQELEKTK